METDHPVCHPDEGGTAACKARHWYRNQAYRNAGVIFWFFSWF